MPFLYIFCIYFFKMQLGTFWFTSFLKRHFFWLQGGADMEERLLRLEGERDALRLQVQVLGEQLSSQADKIADLSECLDEKRQQLKSAENVLQRVSNL